MIFKWKLFNRLNIENIRGGHYALLMKVLRCRWPRHSHLQYFGSALSCGCAVPILERHTHSHSWQVSSPCWDGGAFTAWCLLSGYLLMYSLLFSSRHCTPQWHAVRHSTRLEAKAIRVNITLSKDGLYMVFVSLLLSSHRSLTFSHFTIQLLLK